MTSPESLNAIAETPIHRSWNENTFPRPPFGPQLGPPGWRKIQNLDPNGSVGLVIFRLEVAAGLELWEGPGRSWGQVPTWPLVPRTTSVGPTTASSEDSREGHPGPRRSFTHPETLGMAAYPQCPGGGRVETGLAGRGPEGGGLSVDCCPVQNGTGGP
ncbi:hypothetical protein P7K49_005960 [Saguinus oedipus]|uniref:Uncharacterized protein n=1 Tax=Saguinus oedipus TaxID=9490 RepID=A0ABQ9W117_SAGOE|nr:hypothetical protein P7K49_005960 [Saguinus oedipus]